MRKRNKIIYWIATIWLCLGMVTTAVVQLIPLEEEVEKMTALGYPIYFLAIIGVWKLLGALVILIPKYGLLKEWAYAGFFFVMSGAIFSHVAQGDDAVEYIGPALLLLLTVVSWYFRPADRRIFSSISLSVS